MKITHHATDKHGMTFAELRNAIAGYDDTDERLPSDVTVTTTWAGRIKSITVNTSDTEPS